MACAVEGWVSCVACYGLVDHLCLLAALRLLRRRFCSLGVRTGFREPSRKGSHAESADPRAPASLARLDYLKLTQSFHPGRAMSSLLSLVRVFCIPLLSLSLYVQSPHYLRECSPAPLTAPSEARILPVTAALLPPLLAQQLVQALKHERKISQA